MGKAYGDKAPFQLLVAQSLSASFFGPVTNVQSYIGAGYTAIWSGSAVGTMIVQNSSDGVNFVNLAPMDTLVLNNASDFGEMIINCTGLTFIRPSYTSSSGTGTMTINLTLESKGGS